MGHQISKIRNIRFQHREIVVVRIANHAFKFVNVWNLCLIEILLRHFSDYFINRVLTCR